MSIGIKAVTQVFTDLACHRAPDFFPLVVAPFIIQLGSRVKDENIEQADANEVVVAAMV